MDLNGGRKDKFRRSPKLAEFIFRRYYICTSHRAMLQVQPIKTCAYIAPWQLITSPALLITNIIFLWHQGKVWETPWRERQRQADWLFTVPPPCRAVKHIEGWRVCTGQLLWRKEERTCQTHRCRVMSHCVLEYSQKSASLFCSLVLRLLFSLSVSLLLFVLCQALCLCLNLTWISI